MRKEFFAAFTFLIMSCTSLAADHDLYADGPKPGSFDQATGTVRLNADDRVDLDLSKLSAGVQIMLCDGAIGLQQIKPNHAMTEELDATQIVATIETLSVQIRDRFPQLNFTYEPLTDITVVKSCFFTSMNFGLRIV